MVLAILGAPFNIDMGDCSSGDAGSSKGMDGKRESSAIRLADKRNPGSVRSFS